MSESACIGMKIKVINSAVTYTDGEPAPITITAAAPSSSGKHAGYLTDANGNSPPQVPITVANNTTYSFTAGANEGSEGWASGSLSIQCRYTTSENPSGGTAETITVGYSGEPNTIHSNGCTGSATSSTYESPHFTITAGGSKGTGSGCTVTFTVMNGGSTGSGSSSTGSGSSSTGSGSSSTEPEATPDEA